MLHLVSGNIEDRKGYINELIVAEGGDPSRVTRITLSDLTEERTISDIVITQSGLFGNKEFFILTDMARELPLRELLEEYASSNNLIIFSEVGVTKKITQEFERVDSQHKEFAAPVKESKKSFNIFGLADALGQRDKKNLWLGFRQALNHASPEEINGVLLWQLKNMAMVMKTTGSVPGMKPFVLKKNQGFIKQYSYDEILSLISQLTYTFHNRDVYDTVEVQMEKIILSL